MLDGMHVILSGGKTVDAKGRPVDTLSLGIRRASSGNSPWTIVEMGRARSGTPAAALRDLIYGGAEAYISAAKPALPAVATASPKPVAKPATASTAWPLWAKAIGAFRETVDAGVGDTVHRMLGAPGTAFKAMMTTVGAPCGCNERKDEWNRSYPYTPSTSPTA